ncbi:MAG TPA: tol-pal system protein YbgF [Nitrospirota bacterium]|jgi:tol-pal system protein YbgF
MKSCLAAKGALAALLAVSALVPLGGCVALQQDLDPIRSDISVLEKQFMEVQKDVARAKYSDEGQDGLRQINGRIADMDDRMAAIEKKLGGFEAQLKDIKSVKQAVETPSAPQPIAPEPVVIEPMDGASAPAPAQAQVTPTAPQAVPPKAPAQASPAAEVPKAESGAADDFKSGMDAYNSGDMDKAAGYFDKYLTAKPKDKLSDDARFWLGEVKYSKKDYSGAVNEFEALVQDYPAADRVPDALYESGQAFEALADKDRARQYYTRVMDNYPYSEAAKKARKRLDAAM